MTDIKQGIGSVTEGKAGLKLCHVDVKDSLL